MDWLERVCVGGNSSDGSSKRDYIQEKISDRKLDMSTGKEKTSSYQIAIIHGIGS